MAWFPNGSKRPDLDLASFNLFMKLCEEKRYNALNHRNMDSLAKRLKAEGYSKSLISAIVWRFKNVAGLC